MALSTSTGDKQQKTHANGTGLRSFFVELKRRKVYRVAVGYVVVGWILVQVVTQTFPFFGIPNWVVRLIMVLVILGFPVALVLSWAFDLTPAGLMRTEELKS